MQEDAESVGVIARPDTGRKVLYAIGNFPNSFIMGVMNAWLMYYYCPPGDSGRTGYVAPALYGTLIFLLNIPSGLADPTVGHLSDRTRSRWGRRIPYILWGTPVLALAFAAMWFPPVRGVSTANAVWLTVTVLIYYLSFTAVVNPYLAIMPEVWQAEKDRMAVSSLMAVTGAVGGLLSFAVGALIQGAAGGVAILGLRLNGYAITAILGAALTILLMAPTVLWIRETPHSEAKEVPFNFLRSGWQTLKNPAFLPYIIAVSLLSTGTNILIAMMPYQVQALAGSSEAVTGGLLGGVMILAMVFFVPVNKLAGRIPRRKMMMGCCLAVSVILPLLYFTGKVPGIPPLVYLGVLMFLMAPLVSVFLVLPRTILADVMDYDQELTGYRREAMYNGMEGLIVKVASGLAPGIMGLLFSAFGNTADRPLGIQLCAVAAGALALAGFVSFLFYPLRK